MKQDTQVYRRIKSSEKKIKMKTNKDKRNWLHFSLCTEHLWSFFIRFCSFFRQCEVCCAVGKKWIFKTDLPLFSWMQFSAPDKQYVLQQLPDYMTISWPSQPTSLPRHPHVQHFHRHQLLQFRPAAASSWIVDLGAVHISRQHVVSYFMNDYVKLIPNENIFVSCFRQLCRINVSTMPAMWPNHRSLRPWQVHAWVPSSSCAQCSHS